MSSAPRRLDQLLVIALEQAVAAPSCTVRLADAGARVIKVERAGGETARHYDGAVQGTSAYFAWLNRGKESVVLDVKAQGDRALLEQMIDRADVFVQNLAPGAAERLDLGATQLVKRYPSLVAVDIAGYGQDTPFRGMRAYDMLVQAESGLCSVTGTSEHPSKVGVSIADICTGMTAHAAVLEALVERSHSGKGRAIEISMFDVLADFMNVPLLHHDYGHIETQRVGLAHAAIYPYGAFSCADGTIVIAMQNAEEWRRFCTQIIKRPALVSDARFLDNRARVSNRAALDEIIIPILASCPKAELIRQLEANGLAWANFSTVDDLSHHPALRRTEGQVPGGKFSCAAPPLHSDLVPGPVPALGEHTDRIRAEFAPKSADER